MWAWEWQASKGKHGEEAERGEKREPGIKDGSKVVGGEIGLGLRPEDARRAHRHVIEFLAMADSAIRRYKHALSDEARDTLSSFDRLFLPLILMVSHSLFRKLL